MMGTAALVMGIIGLAISFAPAYGIAAVAPAFLGLVLAMVDLFVKAGTQRPRAAAVAGLTLNALAIIVALAWLVLLGLGQALDGEIRGPRAGTSQSGAHGPGLPGPPD